MSKNVTINGASFSDVPSILVPLTGGTGYAKFIDEDDAGGGGIAGVTELYSNDAVSITYTSTNAGTAKSITGITDMKNYPLVIVIIENTDSSSGSLKFVRSATVIANTKYGTSSTPTVTRYGTEQYYNSSSALTNMASTSYGLWGYTFTAAGALTIRGRCNASYYTSLSGTYKVKVLGVML